MNQKNSLVSKNIKLIFIFIDLRLYLLEPKKNKYLVKTLYGILFILPQGKAFQSLLNRLKHIEALSILDKSKPKKREKNE